MWTGNGGSWDFKKCVLNEEERAYALSSSLLTLVLKHIPDNISH